MEFEKVFHKKIERKTFVVSLGTAAAVLVLMKSFIFNLLFSKKTKKNMTEKKGIKIEPNPLAVGRNKLGNNNG